MTDTKQAAFEAFDNGDYVTAERLYKQLLNAAEPESDEARSAQHMLGFVYAQCGDYDRAQDIYRQLWALANTRADHRAEAICMHQLGMVARLAERYGDAIELFQRECRLRHQHLPDDMVGSSANYYERGFVNYLQGQMTSAQMLMQQALDYANKVDDAMCLGCALRGMGQIAQKHGKADEARAHFTGSAAAFRKAGDEKAAAEVEAMSADFT
jgi:tetratricopeptide (TPR) repeat protein